MFLFNRAKDGGGERRERLDLVNVDGGARFFVHVHVTRARARKTCTNQSRLNSTTYPAVVKSARSPASGLEGPGGPAEAPASCAGSRQEIADFGNGEQKRGERDRRRFVQ